MLVIWNLVLLLRGLQSASAAPTPSNTSSTEDYVAWQSQANMRETWDILVNCIATMSLCIWTALHLNLPLNAVYIKDKPWSI
jgi:hypothetical protein